MSSIVWPEKWKTSSSPSSRTEVVSAAAVTASPRRWERETAASILVISAALAAWIVFHRTPTPPAPVLIAPTVKPQSAAGSPSSAAPQASATTIELLELPESMMRPPARPVPASKPTVDAKPAPPPPLPAPVPKPAENEAPAVTVQSAPTAPPHPIVPLKAEPMTETAIAEEPLPLAPLRPEAREARPVVPLAPDVPKAAVFEESRPIIPLQPEPPRVKPVTALRADPEKPVLETHAVAVSPIKPLAPMDEKPVPPPQPTKPAVIVKAPPQIAPPPPVPQRAPSPPSPHMIVADNPGTAGEGRVLLRLFEQGSGPSIEIRWPSDPLDRDRLYRIFVHCLGMRDGVLDGNDHLYLAEGPRNQSSVLNTDKYSGFIRRPEGAIANDEQQEIARVHSYHQIALSGSPARIFPRTVDAFLIGGLRQAVGENYLQTKAVRAAYRLSGGRVIIDAIIADGHAIGGAIDLSSISSGCGG